MREWMGLGMVFVPVGERLFERYSERGRYYHDARHILHCLETFDRYTGRVASDDAVELALWFHDSVYDVHAPPGKNERDSAEYFQHEFGDLAADIIDGGEVRRLILATWHAGRPGDGDAMLTCDIDLSVLGAEAPRYDAYAADIRREYAFLDDATFREGRRKVLESFLARRSIFATRHFRKLFEERARQNVLREIEALRCGGVGG
jgi:predicted metal-dependent HD superfamily phosphohydrolase